MKYSTSKNKRRLKLENSYVKDEPKKEMKLIINVERLMTNAEENFKNKVEIQNV